MRRISESDNKKRKDLYDKGLNDRQIAEKLHVSQSDITYWRKINHLPPNGRKTIRKEKPKVKNRAKIKLTPAQRKLVRSFLSDLVKCADIARSMKKKCDIDRFMAVWREEYGRKVS